MAKKNGIPLNRVWQMHEIAKKQADKMEQEATARAFLGQLAIPLNILVHEHWPKSAKKKAPKFIDDVLSLQDSWIRGVVTDKELEDLLFEYTGLRMVDLIDCGVKFRTFKVSNYRKLDDHEEGGCRKCGTMLANYGDTNFCPKCGTRLTWGGEVV
jgi:ribosomal protein S27AE